MSPLLTLEEVQLALKLSRSTVHRLVKSGQLRSMKMGSAVRIAERDLEAYRSAAYRQPRL